MENTITIVKKLADASLQKMETINGKKLQVENGAKYSLIDEVTGEFPEGIQLLQESSDLVVSQNGEVLLVIEDFYNEVIDASFDNYASFGYIATAAETELGLFEEAYTESLSQSVSSRESQSSQDVDHSNRTNDFDNIGETITVSEPSSLQVAASSASGSASIGGLGAGWYAGAAVGALGVGAVAEAKHRNDKVKDSSTTSEDASSTPVESVTPVSASTVTISAAAGIFFSTVQVDVYDTSGNLLSSANHDYSTGDYVYTGSYSGPVLVEISDINGDETDYTDETTGEAKSLGSTLRAMATTDGESEEAISVTPLTELATQLAGVTTENRAVSEESVQVNSKVAKIFGLDDLLEKPAVLTEDTSGADDEAVNYGKALAILSGADSSGDTAAAETIATIASALTNDDGSLIESDDGEIKLTSEVTNLLAEGLESYNNGPIGRDNPVETSDFTFASAPTIVGEDNKALSWVNKALVDANGSVKIKVAGLTATDTYEVSVGENSQDQTVAADIDSDNGYISIPVSWFDGEDGLYDVSISVNASDASSTTIKVDLTAPEAPSFELHDDNGDDAADGITSDTTIDVSLASNIASWQYSTDGGSNWITRTSGDSFELKGETEYAVGDIQVRQLDNAGNISDEASNESVITTLETKVPELSYSDSGESDSDGVTNENTIAVEFDSAVDLASWQYSLDGGSTWTTGGEVSNNSATFELSNNTKYVADTILVKQIDAEGNEDIASLSTVITTDNKVSKAITFLTQDTGSSNSDNVTNDATYKVNLASDVDSWEYSIDGGENWVAGSGASIELADGTTYEISDIQVRQTDKAGNVSEVRSNTEVITVDTIAPGAPTFALHADTGESDTDFITTDTTIDVSSIEEGAIWEYSLDGGSSWTQGTGTSFEMEGGQTYEPDTIKVRQTDLAGNQSAESANEVTFTVDSLPSPVLSLADDTGTSSEDYITNNLTVNVELDSAATGWRYRLSSDAEWIDGTDSNSFNLEENTTYPAESIEVIQFNDDGESTTGTFNTQIIADSLVSSEVVLEVDGSQVASTVEIGNTYSNVYTEVLDSEGNFVEVYVKNEDDQAFLMVQHFNADGSESSLPYVSILDVEGLDYTSFEIESVETVGQNGAIFVAWQGYEDGQYDPGNLNLQLFGSDGNPVGEPQQTYASDDWTYDTELSGSAGDIFMAAWSQESESEGINAFVQIYSGVTGEPVGEPITLVNGAVPWIDSTGENGEFNIIWDHVTVFEDDSYDVTVMIQRYDAQGVAIGEATSVNPTESGYKLDGEKLGEDHYAFLLVDSTEEDDEEVGTFSIQVIDADGNVSDRVLLGDFYESNDHAVDVIVINEQGDFAVTWLGYESDDSNTITLHAQLFSSAGLALSEPLLVPYESFDAGLLSDKNLFAGAYHDIIAANDGSGFFLAADYSVYSKDSGEGDYLGAANYFITLDSETSELTYTELDSVDPDEEDWGYFNGALLGDSGNVLIIKETGDAKGFQVYNSSGEAEMEFFELPSFYSGVDWNLIDEGNGGFVLTLSYYDDKGIQYVDNVILDTDGRVVSGNNAANIGEDILVSASEEGIVYLVHTDETVATLEDINSLDSSVLASANTEEDEGDYTAQLDTSDLNAGEYNVYIQDSAGNFTQTNQSIRILSSAELLEEPMVHFAEDTGIYGDDFVTNNKQINVELTDGAISWSYSLDHGQTWSEEFNEDGSFDLDENTTYAINDVQIRQFDESGTGSEIASNLEAEVVHDSEISAPEVNITGNTVQLTFSEDIVYWEYSLDSGDNWIEGSGSSFNLAANTTYPAGVIEVYLEDLAGNEWEESIFDSQIVTEEGYAAPNIHLYEDSGVSDSDGYTYDPGLIVEVSDQAVGFEYSLDGGETWSRETGAYIELDEGEGFAFSDFVGYQVDADGNETPLEPDYDDEDYVEGVFGFDLAEGTVSWSFSTTGEDGEFTTLSWSDADGYFISLEESTYAPGDILVREFNEQGEVSEYAQSESSITIDEERPEALSVAPSYSTLASNVTTDYMYEGKWLEVGDNDNSVFVSFTLNEVTDSDSGDNIYSILLNYLDSESDEVYSTQSIEIGANLSSGYEGAYELGDSGNIVVTWREFQEADGNYSETTYFQIFDGNGPVGDQYQASGYFTLDTLSNGNFYLSGSEYTDGEYTGNKVHIFSNDGSLLETISDVNYYAADTIESNDLMGLNLNYEYETDSETGENIPTVSIVATINDETKETFSIYTADAAVNVDSSSIVLEALGNGGYLLAWHEYLEGDHTVKTLEFDIDETGVTTTEPQVVSIYTLADIVNDNYWVQDLGATQIDGSAYLVSGEASSNVNGYHEKSYFVNYVGDDGVKTIVESDREIHVATVGDQGNFVVITTYEDDYSDDNWQAQLFSSEGVAISEPVAVGVDLGSRDYLPAVVDLENGEYAVSWIGQKHDNNSDTVTTEFYLQKFNADGTIVDPTIIDSNGSVEVQSGEDGVAYLVAASALGEDFLNSDSRWDYELFDTISNLDGSLYNSVEVSANEYSQVSAKGLESGSYYLMSSDYAGNITVSETVINVTEADAHEVVFDLTTGEASNFDNNVFNSDETYEIYINVGDGSGISLDAENSWSGVEKLGEDDTVVLVSDTSVTSFSGDQADEISWTMEDASEATLAATGEFSIDDGSAVELWSGEWGTNPDAGLMLSEVSTSDSPDV